MKRQKYLMSRGERYELCVVLINTRDDGAPSNLTLIPPRHSVHLAGGEEFMLVYINSKMLPTDWESRG